MVTARPALTPSHTEKNRNITRQSRRPCQHEKSPALTLHQTPEIGPYPLDETNRCEKCGLSFFPPCRDAVIGATDLNMFDDPCSRAAVFIPNDGLGYPRPQGQSSPAAPPSAPTGVSHIAPQAMSEMAGKLHPVAVL
ncbi:MAG: hypothetical protein ACE5LL_02515, partial [Alphaproteobacteria bacterium]